MCLINNTKVSRRALCVTSMPFHDIRYQKSKDFDFPADGLIGLAPNTPKGQGDLSYVNALYNQGVIKDKIVALNFEDPLNDELVSTIQFGEIDWTRREGGQNNFATFHNLG